MQYWDTCEIINVMQVNKDIEVGGFVATVDRVLCFNGSYNSGEGRLEAHATVSSVFCPLPISLIEKVVGIK